MESGSLAVSNRRFHWSASTAPSCGTSSNSNVAFPLPSRPTRIRSISNIELATRLGIPLSTTHTISMAIMGVGSAKRLTAVRWGVTGEIALAWILTFPVCGLISYTVVKLVRLFL